MDKPEERKYSYFDEQGRFVFTELYLRERGFCCGNGCKHCPYHYEKVPEPGRSILIRKRSAMQQQENG